MECWPRWRTATRWRQPFWTWGWRSERRGRTETSTSRSKDGLELNLEKENIHEDKTDECLHRVTILNLVDTQGMGQGVLMFLLHSVRLFNKECSVVSIFINTFLKKSARGNEVSSTSHYLCISRESAQILGNSNESVYIITQ